MTDPELSAELVDAGLRLAGVYPKNWLCPTCGTVVADELLTEGSPRPPSHEHYGRVVKLIPRAEL